MRAWPPWGARCSTRKRESSRVHHRASNMAHDRDPARVNMSIRRPNFYLEDRRSDAAPLQRPPRHVNDGITTQGRRPSLRLNDFVLKAVQPPPPRRVRSRELASCDAAWPIKPTSGLHVSRSPVRDRGRPNHAGIKEQRTKKNTRRRFSRSAPRQRIPASAPGKKKLAPAEFIGGTFAFPNLGIMMGSRSCSPRYQPAALSDPSPSALDTGQEPA